MSLDMPIINGGSGYVGSQQSLPGIYMLNENKDYSSNTTGHGVVLSNEIHTTYCNNANAPPTNFRSVKSLSGNI